MNEILHNIWRGLADASWLDQTNLVLGLLGVGLMIKRSLWAFPVGLVAVSVQGVLFFQAKFYADSALQIFFFVTLAWGWRHWARGSHAAEFPVTLLPWRGRLLALGSAALATFIWALALREWTDAIMPWRDAFIAAFSVLAQVLQARKHLDNWPVWVAVNAVAIISYWHADLAYTAFLYGLYLMMGAIGWHTWQQTLRKQTNDV